MCRGWTRGFQQARPALYTWVTASARITLFQICTMLLRQYLKAHYWKYLLFSVVRSIFYKTQIIRKGLAEGCLWYLHWQIGGFKKNLAFFFFFHRLKFLPKLYLRKKPQKNLENRIWQLLWSSCNNLIILILITGKVGSWCWPGRLSEVLECSGLELADLWYHRPGLPAFSGSDVKCHESRKWESGLRHLIIYWLIVTLNYIF